MAHCKSRCAGSHKKIEQFLPTSPFKLKLETGTSYFWNEYMSRPGERGLMTCEVNLKAKTLKS